MKTAVSVITCDSGFSIIELLFTCLLVGILSATAISNLKVVNNPLADATFETSHFLKLVRARAISQTTFLEVAPTSTRHLRVRSAASCATTATYTTIDDFSLDIPNGSRFATTTWRACFTPRGQASANVSFDIQDSSSSKFHTIEVALGGGSQES